jgi:hypothetical protein
MIANANAKSALSSRNNANIMMSGFGMKTLNDIFK